MNILMKKSKIKEIENGELSPRFSSSELINLLNMNRYDEVLNSKFPLKDSIEMNDFFIKNKSLDLIISMFDVKFLERELKIKGADLYLMFKVSKFDMEKLKPYLNKGTKNILAQVRIRKHSRDIYFIENINILANLSEKNYESGLESRPWT